MNNLTHTDRGARPHATFFSTFFTLARHFLSPRRRVQSARLVSASIWMLVVLLVMPLSAPAVAQSPFTTLVVNSAADAPDANIGDGVCASASGQCTLRAAVMEADALSRAWSETIDVQLSGNYTLTEYYTEIEIGEGADVRIIGGNADDQSISVIGTCAVPADGSEACDGGIGGLFDVGYGASLTLYRLKLQGGNERLGAAVRNTGHLKIIDSIITENFGEPSIWRPTGLFNKGTIYNTGVLEITGSKFISNFLEKPSKGGAIYSTGSDASVLIQDSELYDNWATDGGAMYWSTKSGHIFKQ